VTGKSRFGKVQGREKDVRRAIALVNTTVTQNVSSPKSTTVSFTKSVLGMNE
jgi:hypothetical protein